MKKTVFHKIIAVFLSVIVLFSSIGVILNTHYCHTSQTVQKSFLPLPLQCEHEGQQICGNMAAVEGVQQDSCCATHSEIIAKKADNCCEDSTQYLKIISNFELPQVQIKHLFNKFLVVVVKFLDLISAPAADSRQTSFKQNNNGPPPLSGKALAISIHQLKMDPFLL